jgi:hypothetical protein
MRDASLQKNVVNIHNDGIDAIVLMVWMQTC